MQWCNDWLLIVLRFSSTFTCPLQREQEVHSCFLKLENTFKDFYRFEVTLNNSENSHKNLYSLNSSFYAAKNSK